MTDNRLKLAIQALRDEYEVQTQGVLDDDLSDTSISVDCGDLFIALEALDSLAELLEGTTPGPWHFDGEADNHIVWSGPEERVCFLASNGPTTANARLIAAAPVLAHQVGVLRKGLAFYADSLCEFGTDNTGCGKYDSDICHGCKARALLERVQ